MTLRTRPAAVPGPRGSPVFGSALAFRKDPLPVYTDAMREYGDVVRWRLGPPRVGIDVYDLFHPAGIGHALGGQTRNYEKRGRLLDELSAQIGNGLFTSEGDGWKAQRRTLQPLFTHKRVASYAGIMGDEAAAVIDRWRQATTAGTGEVELHTEMTRTALHIVGRTLFGDEVDAAVPVFERFLPLASARILRRGTSPVPLPPWLPTPAARATAAARAEANRFVDSLVARGPSNGESDTLVDLLHGARDPETGAALDAGQMRDQVMVFLAAGHETTATALTFALYLLGRHPEQQARVRAEAEEVLGGRPATAADLAQLPVITMVAKEALRLYPPAYAFARQAVAEDEIDGHVIPAGALMLISPWATHRHPEFWPDPERFDPDRFTRGAEADRHRYAWLPFGGGPRACIGTHFSVLEIVAVIAPIVPAFDLDCPQEHLPLAAAATLRPAVPVRCRVSPR